MPTTTGRLGLLQPIGSDSPAELRIADTTNTNILDNAVLYTPGALAARPAASAVPAGSIYYATDAKTYYWSTGIVWLVLPLAGVGGLTPVVTTVNAALTIGQLMIVDAGGKTMTLPAPGLGYQIGVLSATGVSGASPTTITCTGGTSIYGVGCPGVVSIPLGTAGSMVMLEGDGGSHWIVVSGVLDSGWVPLGLASAVSQSGGYVPSSRQIGDRVWLKGQLVHAGLELGSKLTFATIGPAAHYPTVNLQSVGSYMLSSYDGAPPVTGGPSGTADFGYVSVSTGGALSLSSLFPSQTLSLDGMSYSLA